MPTPPSVPAKLRTLPYRPLQLGRDYWVLDDALADPDAVRARALARTDWTLGFPHREESWPGMRAQPALLAHELAPIEAWVKAQTGVKRLWQPDAGAGRTLNHNCVQAVGAAEAQARPHTDSRQLCRLAGVLYLLPGVPAHCGTSFFRQRFTDGRLGGNRVPAPHPHLAAALGTRFVPPDSFAEDLSIDARYNRLLVYRADIVHSASSYCGSVLADKRMAAVLFWRTE